MAHPGVEIIAALMAESGIMTGTLEERRAAMSSGALAMPAPEGVTQQSSSLGGRQAEWLIPEGVPEDATVLYFHGGGYCLGSIDSHRDVVGRIAMSAGVRAVSLDYRLAPEDPFPAAVDDALAAYVELLELEFEPSRLCLAGDSAGGGLAVATLLAIRDSGLPMPGAAVCLSPWVDLTQSSPSCLDDSLSDPILSTEDLDLLAALYLGDTEPTTPLASPLWADDLSGMPPMLIEVGEDEPLLDDAASLAGRVGAAGCDVTLNIYSEMVHVFQIFPKEILPESEQSLQVIGAFIHKHLL